MNRHIDFNEFIIFDGAMGTMLHSYGMKAGDLPETYNILQPEIIEEIHTKYINAGANVITTNTFGANRYKYKNSKFTLDDIIYNGVKIARKVACKNLVALNIGPLGQLMEPYGNLSFNDAYEAFKEQVIIGEKAGADLIVIETMSDTYEAKAAILASKENSNLPVISSMTFRKNGRTLTGADILTMVNILQNLGIDAIGINCSLGPKEMLPLINDLVKYSKIPVLAQPNAGLPKIVNNKTTFGIHPRYFSSYIEKMASLGVTIFGGCCGTRPEHIKSIKRVLKGKTPVKNTSKHITATSSSNRTEIIGSGVKIIGERINPTGKKLLEEALKQNKMEYIIKEAVVQKEKGAHILDINVGLPELNEEKLMVKTIKEIQSIVNLPLQIDSVNPHVIEAGVRACNGRPIINSVNGKDKVMDDIFPIAKKYGSLVIGLTLNESGIPKTAKERLEIAKHIIKTAKSYGIPKENLIIDCLVLTASTQQQEVKETIEAVRLVKEELQVATTLGISNVSFGLPSRSIINRTFLASALSAGLDAPILNPLEKDMISTIDAFNLLWNYDTDSKSYIESYSNDKKQKDHILLDSSSKDIDLRKLIIDGRKEESSQLVQKLLKSKNPLEIVDEYLIPALDTVGEKYEKGEIFLPQLIQAAETVKKSFAIIEEDMLLKNKNKPPIKKHKIVIATVKGDIHDIGKNIVKVLLENYGYEVLDLGKDVPIEKIVDTVKKHKVSLVGLSALMTTTVKNIELTIQALKKECPDCKVIAGGAVLNQGYANMIGADFYARDVRDSVNIANKFFKR